jgi:LPS export ABC transporter protein LptC
VKQDIDSGEMKLNKKTTIISTIIIVALVALVAIVLKSGSVKPKNVLKILPEHIDLQIKDFVYTEVGESNSKWEVKADTAQYIKKQNLAIFDKVQAKLTTADGKIYKMTGDKGQMLTDVKDVEIRGNVVIISDSGDRFSTDYLKYSDAEKKLYTDAPVVIENKRMKLKGVGLTIYMNTGELNLSSMVKARIK